MARFSAFAGGEQNNAESTYEFLPIGTLASDEGNDYRLGRELYFRVPRRLEPCPVFKFSRTMAARARVTDV